MLFLVVSPLCFQGFYNQKQRNKQAFLPKDHITTIRCSSFAVPGAAAATASSIPSRTGKYLGFKKVFGF